MVDFRAASAFERDQTLCATSTIYSNSNLYRQPIDLDPAFRHIPMLWVRRSAWLGYDDQRPRAPRNVTSGKDRLKWRVTTRGVTWALQRFAILQSVFTTCMAEWRLRRKEATDVGDSSFHTNCTTHLKLTVIRSLPQTADFILYLSTLKAGHTDIKKITWRTLKNNSLHLKITYSRL